MGLNHLGFVTSGASTVSIRLGCPLNRHALRGQQHPRLGRPLPREHYIRVPSRVGSSKMTPPVSEDRVEGDAAVRGRGGLRGDGRGRNQSSPA